MTRIRRIFHSLVIFPIISSIYSNEHYPLTFNPHSLKTYNLEEENSDYSNFMPCAVACPAKNEKEKNFIKNVTYRNKSLFVQEILAVFLQQNETKMKCEEAFELAVLLHSKKEGEFVEFGYEVYFEESKFESEKIDSADYNKFSPISDGDSIIRRVGNWLKNHLRVPWSKRKLTMRKWGFLWVPKIEVRYSFSSRSLKSLKYTVRPIKRDQLEEKCNDYELSGTWYNTNSHMEKLYEYENQKSIFNNVKIPQDGSGQNGQSGEFLRKHNLVLPYHFRASSPNTISCSNLTTIPLWHEIPDELMDRMEKFLIAIAQVLGDEHELIVLPGVLAPLTIPSIVNEKPIKIYLDDKARKVPVPRITYKIIRHREHKCDEKKGEVCWFDVVIVIHNYSKFTANEKLCPTDECQRLGWDSIQYLDSNRLEPDKSPFVYCCELTDSVAKSISFPLGETKNEALNLKHYPVRLYNPKGEVRHPNIILNQVELEFKKLVDGER